ncbi:SGNH/GDSL hydrolase family protein [Microbacterium azadirachtae]|uniref:SGNH/GDSL hydrolase family protein n=2 Tax=Microbacterium azadirachtae TaxID=582680 RepID=UPI00087FB1A1|nr:SGNH/GDSL hydrolase family protein [Microbacterium azadirachtae]SDL93432.1 GDSL-like Lipase/Acylhydrolase family protein [Microbacterium azadirachtae]SEG14477.1 GDSL-like Lipase/Acylhydrolase family protein [Microbacterium azadirachtae]SEG17056.1 GDSL-like Lipase/Acylhydrolase family protein [Microbacterium azadirachtae]
MAVRHMVALGSSFAAGAGISPIIDRHANRSASNYPHLVAGAIGAHLTDVTISGATTETILRKPQRVGLRRLAPQMESFPPHADVDLVTVTAGGNDLRYLGTLISVAYSSWLEARPATRMWGRRLRAAVVASPPTQQDVETAAEGLASIVEAIHERAPSTRVLLVNYLTVIGPDTAPSRAAPFTYSELNVFRRIAGQLREAFAMAEGSSAAELVDVASMSETHGLGSADPWVQGFAPRSTRQAALFHPTLEGMRAVAGAVVDHIGSVNRR